MKFFTYKKEINPLLALFIAIFVTIYGLVTAKNLMECSIFLLGCLLFYLLVGLYKKVLRALPFLIVVGGLFFLGYYFATGTYSSAWAIVNRIAAIFIAIIPGMSISATRMTRSLSMIKVPRYITLGMLIALSFVPLLKEEVHKIKDAMRTKGATNLFNPKVFYRAFFYPLVMRLVSISDTLSLSIETRGFSITSKNYTIYKKEYFTIKDVLLVVCVIALSVLVIVL